MSYTGDVEVGGPSDVRDAGAATIRKCAVGPMDNNAYLVTCSATGAQLLIDAAADAPRLHRLVDEGTGRLDLLVTTHRHGDHVGALADLGAPASVTTAAGEPDADDLPLAPGVRLVHGDQVRVGDLALDVVLLRGHTPGSVALAFEGADGWTHLFTGDSLFPGGLGNTANPDQSFASLYADVSARVFDVYDDRTWVYPGHGADTTVGAERPHLAEWRERGW